MPHSVTTSCFSLEVFIFPPGITKFDELNYVPPSFLPNTHLTHLPSSYAPKMPIKLFLALQNLITLVLPSLTNPDSVFV